MAQSYTDKIGSDIDQSPVADKAQELQEQVKAKANEAVELGTAEAKKVLADPQGYFKETQDNVTAYTREQPLKALAIAAGVAFVFGALRKSGR